MWTPTGESCRHYGKVKGWNIFRMIFTFTWAWPMLLPQLISGARLQDLAILDELLQGYDRRATPTNHLNSTTPTQVLCELFVRNFGSPNPLTMDYRVDLYLRQRWNDERLKHKDLLQPLDLNDPNLVKAIWKPEVYFPNAKEADFQFVTVPNFLVRIHPGGEILYMLRLRATFSCMMDLSKFPLDRQTCTMEVASFSKTVDELILEWANDHPITTANHGMSQFEMEGIVADKCVSVGQIGNYSCLVAAFHLSRSLGFHLVQSYLPTILMVVISWVSFWMDVNSVPGRVTLGVTTLLTVSSKSTMYVGVPLELDIQENLPQASYVKAIDVWMGTCTGFVFLALLEFTVVNYLWRKDYHQTMIKMKSGCYDKGHPDNNGISTTMDQRERERERVESNNLNLGTKYLQSSLLHHSLSGGIENPIVSVEGTLHCSEPIRPEEDVFLARTIDETCRFAFPLAFACFNFVYWPYYLLT